MRIPADIYEDGDELVVAIDLPGSHPHDIEFLVDATLLCLQVQRPGEDDEAQRAYFRRGRSRSSLCGYVPLPLRVLPGEVRADLREGVLEVRLSIDKESEDVAHYDFSAGEAEPRTKSRRAALRRRQRKVP